MTNQTIELMLDVAGTFNIWDLIVAKNKSLNRSVPYPSFRRYTIKVTASTSGVGLLYTVVPENPFKILLVNTEYTSEAKSNAHTESLTNLYVSGDIGDTLLVTLEY